MRTSEKVVLIVAIILIVLLAVAAVYYAYVAGYIKGVRKLVLGSQGTAPSGQAYVSVDSDVSIASKELLFSAVLGILLRFGWIVVIVGFLAARRMSRD